MMNATTGKNSLHGREFLVVGGPSLVSTSMVLNEIGDYLSLTVEQRIFYKEYVERRRLYMRHNEQEAQLSSNIRGLYNQLIEGLEGAGAIGSIEKCFHPQRDAILRELTTIGLTKAGWYYVVDNLPTDAGQLRGTLLVIMAEKLKSEWADQTQQKIKRIVELSHRLKFLMRLSEADPAERKKFFAEDLSSLPTRKKSVSPQRPSLSTITKFPTSKPSSPLRKLMSPPRKSSISNEDKEATILPSVSQFGTEGPATISNAQTSTNAPPVSSSLQPEEIATIDTTPVEFVLMESLPEPATILPDAPVKTPQEPAAKKPSGRAPKAKAAPKPAMELTPATRRTSRSTAGKRKP